MTETREMLRAYDPELEEKINKLCQHQHSYFLDVEIIKIEDALDNQRRMVRALNKEIERTESVLAALNEAKNILMEKMAMLKK